MRPSICIAGAGGLALAFVLAPLVACGTDSSSSNGGGGTSGGPATSPPPASTSPPPVAQGDPCRGQPLPPDQYFAAGGMCASLVASGLGALRQITFAPDGVLFGVSVNGSIMRLKDEDGDGFFQPTEVRLWATFIEGTGNNCHIDVSNGYLYAGHATGVKRWAWSPTTLTGGAGEDVVVGAPSGGHKFHTSHVYDGYLYVHSGSAQNAAVTPANAAPDDYDDNRSLIRRFALAGFTSGTPMQWLSGEVVTQGLRNANGFTRNAAGRIYAVVNGLDDVHHGGVDVHNDNPGEQVVEIAPGKKYGYPFCFTAQRVVENGNVIRAGTQLWNQNFGVHDDGWCAANASQPATFIQAHSAPLDIVFFDVQAQGALPEKYRGGAFVALHGSWDRGPATGYKVIWIPFDASGAAPMPTSTQSDTTFPYETVFGGGASAKTAVDGPWSWTDGTTTDAPRPTSVAISPIDGALYVTSDIAGTLYRVGLKAKQ